MTERLPRMMRDAFTMIELVVVMVVLAILASLAVYSLGGTMDRHELNRAAETIEMFDARARRDARTSGQSLQASIDRTRGLLTIRSPENREDRSFQLPGRVKITDIRMRRRVTAAGRVAMDINRRGHSPTYAVHLQRGKSGRWLVVLGLSGQVIPLRSEGEVDAILSL